MSDGSHGESSVVVDTCHLLPLFHWGWSPLLYALSGCSTLPEEADKWSRRCSDFMLVFSTNRSTLSSQNHTNGNLFTETITWFFRHNYPSSCFFTSMSLFPIINVMLWHANCACMLEVMVNTNEQGWEGTIVHNQAIFYYFWLSGFSMCDILLTFNIWMSPFQIPHEKYSKTF